MFLLKDLLHTVTLPLDRAATCAALISRLRESHIDFEEDLGSGGELRIVAHCLTVIVNTIVWRCWSDKLLFELRETTDGQTTVKIYAIPNLLRIKVRKDEKTVDPEKLTSFESFGTNK